MTPITIRPAQPSDALRIKLLLGQLGYSDFEEKDVEEKITLHTQSGYSMLVAEADKLVVGFVSLHWFDLAHWHGKLGRITSFCVEEEFRSKGIGGQMLREAEKLLLKQDCIKLEVTSNIRRTGAHSFYLRAGYVEDSRRFVKYRT